VSQWTGPSEQSLAAMLLCTLDSFKLQILPRDGASVPSATASAREFHIDPPNARAHTELRVVKNAIPHGFPRTVPVLRVVPVCGQIRSEKPNSPALFPRYIKKKRYF
jgi:hypothetical protein